MSVDSNEQRIRRRVTIDTLMRRNNSINVIKRQAIPYAQLHKKTYFNALEKILITPRVVRYENNFRQSVVQDMASKAFEDVFKKPPSRIGEARTIRKGKISPRRVVPTYKASTGKVADFLKDDFDDSEEEGNKVGVETSWFDNFVDRKNISLDDQKKSPADASNYNEPDLRGSQSSIPNFFREKNSPKDKILKNKNLTLH